MLLEVGMERRGAPMCGYLMLILMNGRFWILILAAVCRQVKDFLRKNLFLALALFLARKTMKRHVNTVQYLDYNLFWHFLFPPLSRQSDVLIRYTIPGNLSRCNFGLLLPSISRQLYLSPVSEWLTMLQQRHPQKIFKSSNQYL